MPKVDYFSLDIEGAKYEVLKTMPFQDVDIQLFGIETAQTGKIFNGTAKDISQLLHNNGYRYAANTIYDTFFKKIVNFHERL